MHTNMYDAYKGSCILITLPTDVLGEILLALDAGDLANVAATCRFFRKFFKHPLPKHLVPLGGLTRVIGLDEATAARCFRGLVHQHGNNAMFRSVGLGITEFVNRLLRETGTLFLPPLMTALSTSSIIETLVDARGMANVVGAIGDLGRESGDHIHNELATPRRIINAINEQDITLRCEALFLPRTAPIRSV